MGKFKEIFKDLYNEFFGFDVEVEDKREPQEPILISDKEHRKNKYFVLNDKIMIFNMLREEPELLNSILQTAREDDFLVDSLYVKLELNPEQHKCNMVVVHDFNEPKHKGMNIDEFEHIVVLKEDIEEPETRTKYITDTINGRITKVIKKVFTSNSKKPSKNLEFLSYRVKKLIENRKNFYRSINETDRFIFNGEESSEMSEHDEVLNMLCNF